MNTQFVKIGGRIIAVAHIVAITKLSVSTDKVRVWVVNETDPLTFEGAEAVALWKWVQSPFRTLDLLHEPLTQQSSK